MSTEHGIASVLLWAGIGILLAVAIACLLTLIVAWMVPDPMPLLRAR